MSPLSPEAAVARLQSLDVELQVPAAFVEIEASGRNDLLAVGGTLSAASHLVEACGGEVARLAVVIELAFLDGRSRLSGRDVISLIQY